MWIMVAGPYRSGSSDPAVWAQNLRTLNRSALAILEKGHVPIIGVNLALPVIETAGQESYGQIMAALSMQPDGAMRCGLEDRRRVAGGR